MQLFENLVQCKECMNNLNNKCILFPGKNVREENTGCYVGIDKYSKQRIISVEQLEQKFKKGDE